MPTAQFKFHGSLNDFLLRKDRDRDITYSFSHSPAVKDAIEAIGIPHTEIKEIFCHGKPVSFSHALLSGDSIEAHPFTQVPSSPQQFILDVHLGRLARLLRLLGLDTVYQNDFTDRDIVALVKEQERIVLTRDVGLLKHKAVRWGYWLRSQVPAEQLKEVIQRFALANLISPFTRCLVCNGVLERVAKEKVTAQLLPATRVYFDEFFQCRHCKKVYWKGSHYEKMRRFLHNSIDPILM